MKKFFKQLFCRHEGIETITESNSPDKLFIVKSSIKCKTCEKVFDLHPNSPCCYVQHIHSQILLEHWVDKYKEMQKAQQP
jgi:hypothetical protein